METLICASRNLIMELQSAAWNFAVCLNIPLSSDRQISTAMMDTCRVRDILLRQRLAMGRKYPIGLAANMHPIASIPSLMARVHFRYYGMEAMLVVFISGVHPRRNLRLKRNCISRCFASRSRMPIEEYAVRALMYGGKRLGRNSPHVE